MCSVPRQHTVHSSSDGQNPKLLKTTLKDDLWDIGYDERTLLGPRHKIVCMLKASLWQLSHGDNVQRDMAPIVRDTVWQRVWHGQVSASLLPSDSCFPLLTIAGTTCNFAKLPEKCSVTVSKYSNAARFSRFEVCGVSLSFPAPPPLCWKVRRHGRGMGWVSDGIFSIDGLPFTLTSHLHKMFPTLVFCSGLPAPPRHNTPIIPWHPNTRYLLLSFTSATLKHKTASFVHLYLIILQGVLSWLSCLSS